MKANDILKKVKLTANRTGLKIKKHSPEIMLVAGVIGVVGSTVMACKATTKLDEVLDESKEKIDQIKHYTEHPEELPEGSDYTEEDGKKDLAIVYVQSAVKVAKLYAPAVILGGLSIASIVGSHRILNKRNVALAAAYATVDKSFKEYRGRVVERFGKDLDKELRYDIKAKEIEETVVNEKGEEEVVKSTVEVVDPNKISDFARIWDDGNTGWSKDPNHNLIFLNHQQRYANDLLQSRGHLFLNEVYDMLGFKRIPAGNVVGWIYDEKHPIGDNFVDFGIYTDPNDPAKANFVNGYERNILLDFNVDGNIMDLI